jgi:hypothetical protein
MREELLWSARSGIMTASGPQAAAAPAMMVSRESAQLLALM